MARIFIVGGWIAAAFAIIVTLIFGPLVAAYAFVAGAFTIIAVLMVAGIARGIGDWRLGRRFEFPGRRRPVR